jgi:hypothetical protein
MSELKADYQIVGSSEPFEVGSLQTESQLLETRCIISVYPELMGIGPGFRAYGDRLSTPDQLCTAFTKARPAAPGETSWSPIGFSIPTLHGQHAPTVPDTTFAPTYSGCEGR